MRKLLFWLFICVGLYFSARVLLVWDKPNSDSEVKVDIEIPKGTGFKGIATILYEAELIRDKFVFRLYIRKHGLATKLQAGDYTIPRNLTFSEMAEVLQHARSDEISITIPEGYTIDQMDELLAKKLLIEPGAFKNCTSFCDLGFSVSNLEGYLFPSTYFVHSKDFSSKVFIQRLYREFNKQLEPLRGGISESGRTMNEIVTVASMIEREAFTDSEMSQISDVIWKRYDKRMHLGIDATTRYEINNWKRPLLTHDFEKDTPYNTRKRIGLPPTAISNPGIEAIKAAIYPEKTTYWYYLHDRSGQVHFSEDLEEHNRYKRQYLN